MVEINYKCTDCDFSFEDKNLIFYINAKDDNGKISDNENTLEDLLNENIDNLNLTIASLNKENSDKMSESFIAGFLYENYCPNCNELIKTFVPEDNDLFKNVEIERILNNEISKDENIGKTSFKIIFFDFKNTFYKDRSTILENNTCPNCNKEMSLVISEKIPCPKCGGKLKEDF